MLEGKWGKRWMNQPFDVDGNKRYGLVYNAKDWKIIELNLPANDDAKNRVVQLSPVKSLSGLILFKIAKKVYKL